MVPLKGSIGFGQGFRGSGFYGSVFKGSIGVPLRPLRG